MQGASGNSAGKEDGGQRMADFSGSLITDDLISDGPEAGWPGISSCMSATVLLLPQGRATQPAGRSGYYPV